MSEIERLADQMHRSWEGDAWHGPPLAEVVGDVTSAEAVARPLPSAHTIREIVLHVAAWREIARRRLYGEAGDIVPDEVDWPRAGDDADWDEVREELATSHRRLLAAVQTLSESRLDDPVAEAGYSLYVLLHGIIQHDLYHAGQIVLLKKAARHAS